MNTSPTRERGKLTRFSSLGRGAQIGVHAEGEPRRILLAGSEVFARHRLDDRLSRLGHGMR